MSYDILLAILKGVAMPNMQMNFRIDAELKRRGDERFARFGCTPSEAMRRLYEVAARTGATRGPRYSTSCLASGVLG